MLLTCFLLLLVAFASFFLSYYVTKLNVRFASRIILKRIPSFDKKILRAAFDPVRAGIALVLILIGSKLVGIPEDFQPWVKPSAFVFAAFILSWLVFSVVDLLGEWLAEYLRQTGQGSMVGMVPLGRRTLKISVIILALITFLQNIGVHVTALVAGLGVGGIAVALAAQKTIGDLLGGVMLVLDRPIRVGDECKFASQQGIVEEIGIRSTRVRTPDRSLVTVPNSDFVQMQIENLSARDRIRFYTTLQIRRDTTPDQMRYLLVELRRILYAHPKVDAEPARVRFTGVGTYSLDIEINAYVLTSRNAEFHAVREDLLLRFMDQIREAGTALAMPVTENLPPMVNDRALQENAEQKVAALRARKELPMPEFSEQQKEALDDTLDYPPRGSVMELS